MEAELCPDHVHMLVSIPPKYSVASIMGYLKEKSSIATDQISIKEYVDPFEKEEKQKEKNMKKGLGPLKW